MLNESEIEQIRSVAPWFGKDDPPSGWLEVNDTNTKFRGDIDSAEGFFSGTLKANNLDVLTKINLREGSVSSYITTGRKSEREFEIVVPAHFGKHESFVDFNIPMVVSFDNESQRMKLNVYINDVLVSQNQSNLKGYRLDFLFFHGKSTSYGVSLRYFHFEPIRTDTRFRFSEVTGLGSFTNYGSAGIRVR